MKARTYIKVVSGVTNFDLSADIIPKVGAGGVSFNNTINDFQFALVNTRERKAKVNFGSELDNEYYYLTLAARKNEFKIEIDLFNGKITSMICDGGYEGKLKTGFGLGSKISELMKVDHQIYFNLDHSFFIHSPFDGLIIYPPNKLIDSIWAAECYGEIIPDFRIEMIELLDMDFARENFRETLFFEP